MSLAAGCAVALPPPRETPTDEARRGVALLAARWQAFSDLRTLADVRVAHGNERQQFTGALLLKAPASLRFEALSPMGQPLLLATVHEGQAITYDVAAHSAVVGPANAQTAARLFHLPVEPDELVGVLAGHAVPPKDLRAATVLAPDAKGPSLEMIGGLHRQRVWMDFSTGIVRQIQITGGRLEALVTYERAADDTLMGFDLSAAQDNVTGSVRYRDLVVGAGVDPERFRLTIPPGASIERLR